MRRPPCHVRHALAAAALAASTAHLPASAAQDDPTGAGPLSLLRRTVAHFDFEESEQVPLDMPLNFYRYLAADQGYPPFGRMHPSRETASGGNWSFAFELDGGSMAARVAPGILPVLPLADYRVSARVRTEGLTHARARLAAWLLAHTEDGG